MGYSPWGRKASNTIVCTQTHKRSLVSVVRFSRSVVSNSFVTPWTVAHQAPLSTGFSRKEHCSGLLFPPPGDLPPSQGSNLPLLHCRQILYHRATWETIISTIHAQNSCTSETLPLLNNTSLLSPSPWQPSFYFLFL